MKTAIKWGKRALSLPLILVEATILVFLSPLVVLGGSCAGLFNWANEQWV